MTVEQLIRSREAGFSLPQAFYTSPKVFAQDVERVFMRHWLLAGPSCRIPNPGDYFLFDLAEESIIVVRQDDGGVRAFFNVCRHRGSRICLDEQGQAKRFVCPYHAWTYNIDGSLRAARHQPADFPKESYSLHGCNVREVEGLLFICVADPPPQFGSIGQNLEHSFRPHRLPETKICAEKTHRMRANWKVVAENFAECYHCGPSHPELTEVMSYVRAFDSNRAAQDREEFVWAWQERTNAMGHLTGRVEELDGVMLNCLRLPIRPGYKTQSKDGKPVAPLLGELTEYDGGVTAMQFHPLQWFLACNDYAMLTRFTPVSVLETEVRVTWLVRQDAVEGRDYHRDDVTWLSDKTFEEDAFLCENNQAGICSRAYRPGPLSTLEASLESFTQWYFEQVL